MRLQQKLHYSNHEITFYFLKLYFPPECILNEIPEFLNKKSKFFYISIENYILRLLFSHLKEGQFIIVNLGQNLKCFKVRQNGTKIRD